MAKKKKRRDGTKARRVNPTDLPRLDSQYRRVAVRTNRAEWGLAWATEVVRNKAGRIVKLTLQWITDNKLVTETLDLKDVGFSVQWYGRV